MNQALFFACPQCRTHLVAASEEVGTAVNCKSCQFETLVPLPLGAVTCNQCGVGAAFSQSAIGQTFHCRQCHATLHIPAASASNPIPVLASHDRSKILVSGNRQQVSSPIEPPKRNWLGISKKAWCLIDCLANDKRILTTFPFEVGSGTTVDLRITGGSQQQFAIIETKASGFCLICRDDDSPIDVDGETMSTMTPLKWDHDYTIRAGNHLFILRGQRKVEEWANSIQLDKWLLWNPKTQAQMGPVPLQQLGMTATTLGMDPRHTVAYPMGSQMGFYLYQIKGAIGQIQPEPTKTPAFTPQQSHPTITVAPKVSHEHGDNTCPVCWLKFDKGDIMHIAAHKTLMGDPVLGEDEMLRFSATRFNDNGHALDAMGVPCPDIACPHCRTKLPTNFLDIEHHIISLVGETMAGKSYYLSSAARMLPESLYRNFGVVFKDADPTSNRHLNEMKNRLFSGSTPEQVQIEKTQMGGDLYKRVMLHGQEVRLPSPFIFGVDHTHGHNNKRGIVFYDLAGELFQPGMSEYDATKTQHVGVAAGLLFLFDPTLNRGFRARLQHHDDPQLKGAHNDQQDTLLAEMEVRIKRLLGLDGRQRIQTPLAIIIGKCDVWLSLLGADPLLPVTHNGQLDLGAMAENSRRMRGLLTDICPNIVANAESLADKVHYFAVSSFGHSPVRLPNGGLAPDPKRLHPIRVEEPFLWLFSHIMPSLLPISPNGSKPH